MGSKKQNDGATGPRKKFDDIFSRLDTMHQRDGQTDRRTDTGPQHRPRLRIASRGNKTAMFAAGGFVAGLIRKSTAAPRCE